MEKQKTAGNITSLKLNINSPFKSDTTIEMNQLSLFIGPNGSGKTVVLIMTFVLSNIAAGAVARRKHNVPMQDIEYAQWVFDHSFTDNNVDGTIKATYKSGLEVEVTLEKGKVISLTLSGIEEIDSVPPANFMSTQFRTFSAISGYLKVRKMTGETEQAKILEKMVGEYKLYDVIHIEKMIGLMPLTVDERMKQILSSLDSGMVEIESFGVDLDKADFYAIVLDKHQDGPPVKKYLSTFGNGHQAWFNMMIANSKF